MSRKHPRAFGRAALNRAARERLNDDHVMRITEAPARTPMEPSLATSGGLVAPPKKFRAVGVDTFEGPTADYLIGDFDTKEEALVAARKRGRDFNPVYVYSDTGELLGSFGKP